MGFNIAYVDKDKIESAIAQGIIPAESLIITANDQAEASYYDDQGILKPIVKRNTFNSLNEATLWVNKYDCKGQLISVCINGDWTPCIVGQNNEITPFISEEDTIILEAGGAPIPV